MQPIQAFDDAGWTRLLQDTAYYFDDLTLKRGFQYYKQKRVTRLSQGASGILTARVNGTEPYSVELIPNALSISSCSCPVIGSCKHMAAVLMDYAESQGRPVHLLVNARSSVQVRATVDSGAGNNLPKSGEAGGGGKSPGRESRERYGPGITGKGGAGGGGRTGSGDGADNGSHTGNRDGADYRNQGESRDKADSHSPAGSPNGTDNSGLIGSPDYRGPDGKYDGTVGRIGNGTTSGAAPSHNLDRTASGGTGGGVPHGNRNSLKERGRLIPVMNIAQWHELFALCVSPLAGDIRNSRYAEESLAVILRVKPLLEPELEELFNLHARLFVLGALTNRSGAHAASAPSLGYYTHVAAAEFQREIERGLRTEPSLPSSPEQWNRILDTLAYLRRELTAESGERTFYHSLYYLLWRKWIIPQLHGDALFKEELRRLEREEEERAAHPPRQALLTARAWMHFHLSEDEESLSLLREAAGRAGFHPEWLDWFWEPLAEAGESQRLVRWLTETGELLGGHLRRNLESYARHWEEAVRLLPETEPLMWAALTDMLPLSGGIYAEKLMERGRWRQWMDYQLSSGAEPADFRVRDLQPLEKHAPELLLPFYHQAVERYVSQKNRSGYKAAVKLLKRLKKLYKKLKTEDRFERFLQAFTARHSRLRALQEELRKGKLTT